jgi:hypothetical protein
MLKDEGKTLDVLILDSRDSYCAIEGSLDNEKRQPSAP